MGINYNDVIAILPMLRVLSKSISPNASQQLISSTRLRFFERHTMDELSAGLLKQFIITGHVKRDATAFFAMHDFLPIVSIDLNS